MYILNLKMNTKKFDIGVIFKNDPDMKLTFQHRSFATIKTVLSGGM